MKKSGILLINLGSPDAPSPEAVGEYLKEFLMDEKVIDLPPLARRLLVHLIIVPRRKFQSSKLYRGIWTPDGSPLIANSRRLADRLRAALDDSYLVKIGMRYGKPSIADGMAALLSSGADRIVALPLYPQYAESSYETAAIVARSTAQSLGCEDKLRLVPPFYDRPEFIQAWAINLRENLDRINPDHILFSYHSLPVRHLQRLDKSKSHCLMRQDCCERISESNPLCYRAQCLATTRSIADRIGLAADFYSIGFQSRLGRASWVGPQTEDVLRQLAQRGIRRVAVSCPSFVADCLETLEEIGVRARESFLHAGGQELHLVPALNAHPAWVEALRSLVA